MEDAEYELMSEVQDSHWWWLGRQKIVEAIIQRHIGRSQPLSIADVGCGCGAHLSMLRRYGRVTGLEPNEEAMKKLLEADSNGEVRLIKWKCPDPLDEKFDLILMTDVLEHIRDDAEAVSWIYDHLHDGGHALLTVPAHQFFWSQMDEIVHHFRRYSRHNFLELFRKKFAIKKFSFYNFFLFPVKAVFVMFARCVTVVFPHRPKRSYNGLPPRFMNGLFRRILDLESLLIQWLSFPNGVSMVLLVQKKSSYTSRGSPATVSSVFRY